MNPVEITSIVGVIISLIVSVIVPFILARRKRLHDADATGVASWESLTKALQAERDKYKAEVDENAGITRQKMREFEAECDRRLNLANVRIAALETQVSDLKRELNRT